MAPKKNTTRKPRTARPREPVVLPDPRPRWPIAAWTALGALWALGSLVAFVLVLTAAGVMPEDVTDATRREGAWALVWLLVFALAVPAAGTVWAALLRRPVAAVMFAFAFALSGAALWLIAPPAELWAALSGGLGRP
ncbi:hypothetical protein [Nocardiopsis ansamitocini]|uniref:Uncharacterized protein n=1 Tax=Nocardiopsis ansamitocini TaxID=1670832 RepID=A0A9W6UJE9_9ACTN|nr:hypothetical protein [Nocardiopsis ansamitocini]GLU48438.1 hypothetical protein Nans01_27890 [Nocardiopsis ansamitocini]